MKTLIAYYDGLIGEPNKIKVPISDRSIFFGDAVYDAALLKDGKIFLASEHVERLLNGAKILKIKHNFTAESLMTELERCTRMFERGVYFIYFQLSRRSDERIHSYKASAGSSLFITVSECRTPSPDKALSLVSLPDTRYLHCNVKTVNLLPAVMASGYAEENGADEAVFVRDGIVTECAHSNISILQNGVLYTHPLTEHILPGITRSHLLECCRKLGVGIKETGFSLSDLRSADEVLVTSTTKLCVRAEFLDGFAIGGKNTYISKKICAAMLDEFVHYS